MSTPHNHNSCRFFKELSCRFGTPPDGFAHCLDCSVTEQCTDPARLVAALRRSCRMLLEQDLLLAQRHEEILNVRRQKSGLETQLRQAQKMEVIGQLTGGIAHDFNNIIAAIGGYSHILKSQDVSGSQVRYYSEQIQAATGRATKMIRDLLAFGRREAMDLEPVHLNRVVASLGDMLDRLIGDNIELCVHTCAERLVALIDEGHVQQIIMNLVTNARDAMPDGGAIRIRTYRCSPAPEQLEASQATAGPYACIEVCDSGIGMDASTREKVFEPFFTTKEQGKGSGLGLSIVYGIVKQHNGFLEIASEPGRGTVMSVYLPLSDGMVEEEPLPLLRQTEPVVTGGNEAILLAEDNRETRVVYREILEDAGYRVFAAEDGGVAVDLFARYRDEIDLVMLDFVMPKKNGHQVLHEIRFVRPGVKYLFSSGYAIETINDTEPPIPAENFLPKPAPPLNLLAKVRQILDTPA